MEQFFTPELAFFSLSLSPLRCLGGISYEEASTIIQIQIYLGALLRYYSLQGGIAISCGIFRSLDLNYTFVSLVFLLALRWRTRLSRSKSIEVKSSKERTSLLEWRPRLRLRNLTELIGRMEW